MEGSIFTYSYCNFLKGAVQSFYKSIVCILQAIFLVMMKTIIKIYLGYRPEFGARLMPMLHFLAHLLHKKINKYHLKEKNNARRCMVVQTTFFFHHRSLNIFTDYSIYCTDPGLSVSNWPLINHKKNEIVCTVEYYWQCKSLIWRCCFINSMVIFQILNLIFDI